MCSGAGESGGSQQLLGTGRLLCPDKDWQRMGTPTACVCEEGEGDTPGLLEGVWAEADEQGGIMKGATCLFKA